VVGLILASAGWLAFDPTAVQRIKTVGIPMILDFDSETLTEKEGQALLLAILRAHGGKMKETELKRQYDVFERWFTKVKTDVTMVRMILEGRLDAVADKRGEIRLRLSDGVARALGLTPRAAGPI